jgi:predicted dehydrogenase
MSLQNNISKALDKSSPWGILRTTMMTSLDQTSRRQFLATTAALPLILPSGMWGASRSGKGPNSRITLGLIGIGRRLGGIAGAFADSPDAQMVAVCDCVDARREWGHQRVTELYQQRKRAASGVRQLRDFRELIADPGIDAVAIGTPDHWHAIQSVLAARAGKHVYCEKPLTRTIGEGRAVVKAARKAGIVFQTGSQQRTEYNGRFRTAVEYVRSGRIGDLREIFIGVGGPNRPDDLPDEAPPPGIDWEMWLGPAPRRGFNQVLCPIGLHKHFPRWRDYREYAGGPLADIGAHHFDIAQWAMNEDHSGPVKITPPDDPSASHGLVYEYASGVRMHHDNRRGRRGCLFVGTRGELYVDRGTLESTPDGILKQPLDAGDFHLPAITPKHQQNWLDCILSGGRPVADVEVGHRTNTICALANLAYQLDRPLDWDPKAERFKDDPEADSLILQPDRDPWFGIAA